MVDKNLTAKQLGIKAKVLDLMDNYKQLLDLVEPLIDIWFEFNNIETYSKVDLDNITSIIYNNNNELCYIEFRYYDRYNDQYGAQMPISFLWDYQEALVYVEAKRSKDAIEKVEKEKIQAAKQTQLELLRIENEKQEYLRLKAKYGSNL